MPENFPGDFFVDSTCINCDTCRQIAPAVFGEVTDSSFVKAQPVSNAARRQALQAVLACPTRSIGCLGDDDAKSVMQDFPLVIAGPVFYCGYNSPKSYGGKAKKIPAHKAKTRVLVERTIRKYVIDQDATLPA